jgi:type IV pilus assembly protein PilA
MATNVRLKLGVVLVAAACVLVALFIANDQGCGCSPQANESSAVGSLRAIYSANFAYAKNHSAEGYPRNLNELSLHSDKPEQPHEAEWVLDPVIAAGTKSGYRFVYSPGSPMGDRKSDSYGVRADPVKPGKSGKRYFFMNETGMIHVSELGPANSTDPVLH